MSYAFPMCVEVCLLIVNFKADFIYTCMILRDCYCFLCFKILFIKAND
jgi:hypothetical protein